MVQSSKLKLLIAFCLVVGFLIGSNLIYAETIIGYGDSITAGTPYITYYPKGARVGGYEPPLEALLADASAPSKVKNYGYPGELSTDGVNRINGVLNANSGAAYILILEGANDVYTGISSQTTVYNLGIMIDKSIAHNIKPVIGTMTPHPYSRVNTDYNPGIIAIAQQKGAQLADLYTRLSSNWFGLSVSDRLHPNRAGYERMAQTWFDTIFRSGGVATVIGGGGDFTVYTWDAADGLSASIDSMGNRIAVNGTRASWTAWGQGAVNYITGATRNTLLPSEGSLTFNIVATGADGGFGGGTGYKLFVQFWNDAENYIALGIIHDPAVAPQGVTVMVEGAAYNQPVGGYWTSGMPVLAGAVHQISVVWDSTGLSWVIDGLEDYRMPYSIRMDHASLSFLGGARLPGDSVSAEFGSIDISL